MWVKPYRIRPGCKKAEHELTADDVVNEVTIYVQEGNKQSVPVYLYSGGEASIIALAMLVALWQLADEYGSGTNLLLLDEVVGFLDANNSQIVVRFLEGLKTAGKTVIAVSHSQVVDSVSFDAKWIAVKENDVSRLVQA
jgi:DNA repair exonuclease SbcCD ATPase subunit